MSYRPAVKRVGESAAIFAAGQCAVRRFDGASAGLASPRHVTRVAAALDMPRPRVSHSVTLARNRVNRINCDNRQHAFRNVLVALLQAAGFCFVVRRPGKVATQKAPPTVPVARVTRLGRFVFDAAPGGAAGGAARRAADARATGFLVGAAGECGIACDVSWGSGDAPRPHVREIRCGGAVFTGRNVIAYGQDFFAAHLPEFRRGRDEAFELAGAPRPWAVAAVRTLGADDAPEHPPAPPDAPLDSFYTNPN